MSLIYLLLVVVFIQKVRFFLRSIDMLFKILTLEKKYEKHCSDYVAIKVYFSLFLDRV